MHSLKILPPPPALPRHRCSPYQTVLSRHPPWSPFWSFGLAVRRSLRTLRAVIVVLVLWLVRETFSDLLLG